MRVFLMAFLLAVAGCSGTGGDIGGLLPAPKFLDGTVQGSKYVAPGNAFSVSLPYSPVGSSDDQYEWTYAKVHEISDGPVIGIVVGPGAFDRNYYHAVLIRMQRNEHDRAAMTEKLFASKVASRGGSYDLKSFKIIQVNGLPCFYAVYESQQSFLVLSLADKGSSFFVVEADILKNTSRNSPADAQQLIDRNWPIFNTMLESFDVDI